jgi:gluconate 2-dehydrogenase gamma chain
LPNVNWVSASMDNSFTRRQFLSRTLSGVSVAWLTANFPAAVSAAKHAHEAAQSSAPPKFEFFTSEEAVEVDAIASRIIPTDNQPGAHEAGTVYFIDRALMTFAADDQKTYRAGLPDLQARTQELFPGVAKFSAASPDQQDQILKSIEQHVTTGRRGNRSRAAGQSFFETVRTHTISAFLIDPDFGGNHDGVGWKLIGRDRAHMFQPPFGFYDKNYPGWQPYPATDKGK